MKKRILICIIVSICMVAGAVATLGIVYAIKGQHEHEFATEWSESETMHWRECECGEKIDKEQHIFGDWVEKTSAMVHQNRVDKQECSVCGFEVTREVEGTMLHDYDLTAWRKNSGKHWRECECGEKAEEEHISVADYSVLGGETAGVTVSTSQRCCICGYTTAQTVMPESSYTLIDDATIEGKARTISNSGIYVLTGNFTNTIFTVDAQDVTLVGVGAETSNVEVVLTENSANTVLYGLKIQEKIYNSSLEAYGDLTVSKCTLQYPSVNPHKENLNIIFDGNSITGAYGIYFNYNDSSDKFNTTIANNTFDEIGLYVIFFYSASNQAEVGEINIANNNFINGWGEGQAKRATLKFYMDKNISPVDWGDITDTSKLTETAKTLVRKILASNNTFDKNGKTCSYFNINGVYFDTLDE